MNGFLVIGLLHGFDVPLRLFASRRGADYFADVVSEPDVLAALRHAWEGTVKAKKAVPLGVAVQEFVEGEPREWDVVKHFQEPS